MSKEEKTEVKEEVRGIADFIKKQLKHKSGGEMEVPEDVYEKTLPEGLDLKTVKKVQKHNSNFVAAAELANGEKGLDLMKKEKDIDRVHSRFKVGADRVDTLIDRSREKPDGDGGKTEQFGVSDTSFTVAAAGNKAALKQVRSSLAEQAKKALSK